MKLAPRAARAVVATAAASLLAATAAAQPSRVGMIEITGAPVDQPGPLAWLTGNSDPTLLEYVHAIRGVATSDDYDAIILRLKDATLTNSQVDELGAAVEALRDSGKPVHFFSEGLGVADFTLGAFTDEIIVQAGGPVSLPGLYMEELFLADTLDWIGLDADFVQVGIYKGADEQLTRSEPSEAWNENINGLLDATYEAMRAKIREGRGLSDAQLDRAMERLWFAQPEDAIRLGLADAAVDLADIIDHLEDAHGEVEYAGQIDAGGGGAQIDMSNPFAALTMLNRQPSTDATEPTIAVLHLAGPIVDGDSTSAGLLGGASVGSRSLRNAMTDIADDDEIRGVVVRIDSPGGSATASEMIWLGLRRLAESKPVWVSVGSMAASGGYYSAVGGDKIYVNPTSIVGSIGVVGGKISMGDLYDKAEIGVVERARGPRADLLSTADGWSATERSLVRDRVAETYEQFADRVRAGRPGIDLDRVGQGRLFLGTDAVKLGMADELGGLDKAIRDLAADLDLDDYEIMHFPGAKSFEEVLEDAFGGFVTAPRAAAVGLAADAISGGLARTLAEAIGRARFEAVRDQLSALLQLRDQRVLLVSPRAVLFR